MKEARAFSKKILQKKEIVCVNIIKSVESYYKEDGKIISNKEIILIIKTSLKKIEIEKIIKKYHPYKIPFITKLKNDSVNSDYLDWAKKL